MSELELPIATAAGRELIDNTNLLVMGKKREGKTTLTEDVIIAKKTRLLVVDTFCKDYTHGTIFTNINEFGEAIAEKNETGEFRFIVRCPHQEDKVFELLTYSPTLKRARLINSTIVVEEISNFTNSHYIHPALEDHYQYGGHSRNNLIGVTRFPYEIHRTATRLSDLIISLKQEEKNDLDYFAQFKDRDEVEKLRSLKRGHYLVMKGTKEEFLDFIGQP